MKPHAVLGVCLESYQHASFGMMDLPFINKVRFVFFFLKSSI